MGDLYALTERDYDLLKEKVIKELGGKPRVHPPPQRRRRLGSSASKINSTRKARVTVEIAAAEGPLTADWGTGTVRLQDGGSGELDEDPTDVENDNIGTSWEVDAQVTLDMSYDPPRVIGGSCGAVSWGESS